MNGARKGRRRRRAEKSPATLPPILFLEEFVAEMERQYGDRLDLSVLKAAMVETKPHE
jgi:hypothetical protein